MALLRVIRVAIQGIERTAGRSVAICTFIIFASAAFVIAPAGSRGLNAATGKPQVPGSQPSPYALVNTYCVTCHNQQTKTAGLALDTTERQDVAAGAEVWEKVIQKLRMDAMPPAGLPRPDREAANAFIRWLETNIDRASAANLDPGRTEAYHRLNRAEYKNAIRDLIGLDVDVTSMLPADHATFGFDNIADELSISPALMEGYMSAARKISLLAVGLPPRAVVETDRLSHSASQDERVSEDLPFGSRGGAAIRHYFPVDGEYVVKVRLRRQGYDYIIGLREAHRMDVRIDGTLIKEFTVGGGVHGRPSPTSYSGNLVGDQEWEQYNLHGDDGLQMSFTAKAGTRIVGVSFVEDEAEPDGYFRPEARRGGTDEDADLPAVDSVSITGPNRFDGPGDTESRRRIFICRPKSAADEGPCARDILAQLSRRGFRRPATPPEIDTLLRFYQSGRKHGSFDNGIQFALERLLVDPNFLFRIERDPQNGRPGAAYSVSDYELASRLSFFLWSTIPDETLLDLAARGKLHEADVLNQQARRMLADSRSEAFRQNFFGQWLELRSLPTIVPDARLFPDFDDKLLEDFETETNLFIASQLSEDRSLLDLLTANYTFVNERLARHYGIPAVSGESFRRVQVTDQARIGLLGESSILMLTSYPNRTSPVLRGKWVLDDMLGTPPAPPPPNVPALKDTGENGQSQSVRERLEDHRKNPVCASCHAQMDPFGFALENFDAIGSWRSSDAGAPIDASSVLPNGTRIDGAAGLRKFLLDHQEQYLQTVVEKLLSYSLGRPIEYYDMPTVRSIVKQAASTDYRWSSVILGIVDSAAFRMRMPESAATDALQPAPLSQNNPTQSRR